MLIHKFGVAWEETKAIILVNKIAEDLFGTKGKKPKIPIDKPPPSYDSLKQMFGDKVKKLEQK